MNNARLDNALCDIDNAIHSLNGAYYELEKELEKTDKNAVKKLREELLADIEKNRIRDEANELCFQKAAEYRAIK